MKIRTLPVDCYDYINKDDFQAHIAVQRKPLVIRNFDIGQCQQKWTINYFTEKLGKMDVRVHIAPVGRMNFLHKNFMYKTISFEEFLTRSGNNCEKSDKCGLRPILCDNEVFYLRAIGSDKRGKNVANLKTDYPLIADDLVYPDLFEEKKFFSSVLRIASAGVQIWTHYDVMDNILIQVSGTKRVILFNPNDAPYMYLNGDKSEVMDIDNPDSSLYPDFFKAVQHVCVLQPGDILYIPAFWFHNVLCNSFSIGVNVFWKHLDNEMYEKHDVYGNKDIIPAAKALDHINKARNLLKSVPEECRYFYLQRCIADLSKPMDEILNAEIPKTVNCKNEMNSNAYLHSLDTKFSNLNTSKAGTIKEEIAHSSNFDEVTHKAVNSKDVIASTSKSKDNYDFKS